MKIIVLDRDGVINHDSNDYIKSAEEFLPIDNSIFAIARLCAAGFKVVVATNQSGLARKYFNVEQLSEIHHLLCSMVEEAGGVIDGIFYCPHHPDEDCSCRKPRTGLLQQIEKELACRLQGCYFVGDSMKDLEAALAFDCNPILVRTGKGLITEQLLIESNDLSVPTYDDLSMAVSHILGSQDAI
ncbi:MAG: D-glycero-beta-D-manno-heptose 1,7-bisphosphate 7-phosphatase [Proteobacteria bacterium]|jgi:D-glycero-D-manno-heptose 1,7-bisphosphate phosphatase|nr:D-glycero-beta-D-manno-heptose 1,7-bisphosphate 7-phosphatase [Pseudomonadota bacterium]MDA1289486.1 D-glycero-beta-D-manno-heptose 1,7-bisphosphate 7-phosphatase [Pseudomonadota bacterium]